MNDNIKKDILNDPRLKENPFSLPEGYLSSLENSVHEKIFQPETVSPLMTFLYQAKSALVLACSFAIIFGLGYGVFAFTSTLPNRFEASQSNDLAVLIENGYINSSFIDDLYDEIDFQKGSVKVENEIVLDEEASETIQEKISEKDLMEYLGIEVPSNQ